MTRLTKGLPAVTLLAAATAFAHLAWAPAAFAQAAPAVQGPALPKLVLEPEAEAALNRMGASLRALGAFQVTADYTSETVYPGNHKLMSVGRAVFTVQFPDRMTVDMRSGLAERRVYYNGQQMTVVAPRIGRYVSFPVAGSVSDVLAAAYEDYGLEFPLQDLFRWGAPGSDVVRPTAGYRLGDTMIGDRKAVHYAYAQPGVDFQVWLDETGPQTLPLMMVITNTEHPAQPQYVARYTWNQAPAIDGSTFTFQPGPNDRAIDIGAAKAALKSK